MVSFKSVIWLPMWGSNLQPRGQQSHALHTEPARHPESNILGGFIIRKEKIKRLEMCWSSYRGGSVEPRYSACDRDQQHQHHLKPSQQCRLSSPSSDLLSQHLHFYKIICAHTIEMHAHISLRSTALGHPMTSAGLYRGAPWDQKTLQIWMAGQVSFSLSLFLEITGSLGS